MAAVFYSCICAAAQTPKLDDNVAKVNGRVLTRTELYDQGAKTLLQQRYDFYRAERDALGRVIDDQLLEQEAGRRNISVAQLLELEVTSNIKDPSDSELRVLYEGAQTDQPYEALRAQLLARVRQSRTKKLREAFLGGLRQQAKIQIVLAPPFADVALDSAPTRGPKNAPVALVEFADYECPFCRQMQPEIEELLKDYNGKLTLYFKDFPLAIHAHAGKASQAARCAEQQGAFWPYHDILFHEGASLELPQLKQYARGLRLDAARFDACLDAALPPAEIQNNLEQGQRLGIAGTPAFFINGHFLSGVVSYETLREVVDQSLNLAQPMAANVAQPVPVNLTPTPGPQLTQSSATTR